MNKRREREAVARTLELVQRQAEEVEQHLVEQHLDEWLEQSAKHDDKRVA